MLRRLIMFAIIGLLFYACDRETDKKKTSDASQPSDTTQTSETQEDAPSTLPDYCLAQSGEEGQKCLECTPRTLPLTKCFAASADFNLTENCLHDDEEKSITCLLESGDKFVFDLSQGKVEKLFEILPLMNTSLKVLLTSKLEGKDDLKNMAFGTIDIVSKYKLSIFTGKELEVPAAEIKALVKKEKPDIDDETLNNIETQMLAKMKEFSEKSKSSEFSEADLFNMAKATIEQIPGAKEAIPEDVLNMENFLSSVSIDSLLKFLPSQE